MPEEKYPRTPLFLELSVVDQDSIDKYAEVLGVTSDEIRAGMAFGREIMAVAKNRSLTIGQVIQAVMGVAMWLVKESGSSEEQRKRCATLVMDIIDYCEIEPLADRVPFAASNPRIVH
jgi:hypothetical protein